MLIHLHRQDSDETGEDSEEDDDEALGDGSSDDDDDDEKAHARPYMALLQGFNDSSAPKSKRRKLDHGDSPEGDNAGGSDQEEGDQTRDLDAVEEPEDPAIGLEEQPEDSDDEDDADDPFDVHYAQPNEELISQNVKAVKSGEWASKRTMMQSWRATLMSPGSDGDCEVPQLVSGLDSLRLKQKLAETAGKKMGGFNMLQRTFGSVLFDYRDVMHCDRNINNSDQLRQLTCLHALNHIFK